MNTLIVADESVDFAVIERLRESGFEVFSIAEKHAGWSDAQVLDYAFRQNAYLITEDKDFGELTYRLQKPSHGILLVRMPMAGSEEKAKLVLQLIQEKFAHLWMAFSVLEAHKLRVKSL